MTSRGGQPDEMSSLGRHVTLAFGSGNMTYLGMTFRQVALLVGHYFYNITFYLIIKQFHWLNSSRYFAISPWREGDIAISPSLQGDLAKY